MDYGCSAPASVRSTTVAATTASPASKARLHRRVIQRRQHHGGVFLGFARGPQHKGHGSGSHRGVIEQHRRVIMVRRPWSSRDRTGMRVGLDRECRPQCGGGTTDTDPKTTHSPDAAVRRRPRRRRVHWCGLQRMPSVATDRADAATVQFPRDSRMVLVASRSTSRRAAALDSDPRVRSSSRTGNRNSRGAACTSNTSRVLRGSDVFGLWAATRSDPGTFRRPFPATRDRARRTELGYRLVSRLGSGIRNEGPARA